MIGDPWPEEPEDPYPEPGDPSESLEIPTADGAPKELFRAFWGLVALFNVGLFGLALGALLVAFRGDVLVGGALLGIGAVTTGYGLHRYRVYTSA